MMDDGTQKIKSQSSTFFIWLDDNEGKGTRALVQVQ